MDSDDDVSVCSEMPSKDASLAASPAAPLRTCVRMANPNSDGQARGQESVDLHAAGVHAAALISASSAGSNAEVEAAMPASSSSSEVVHAGSVRRVSARLARPPP
jgi:hypothetical protein